MSMWVNWRWIVAALTMTLAATGALAGNEDVLDPDDAFRLSVERLDARTVRAVFAIAPGHYLYRDRLKFSADGGRSAPQVELPQAELKDDPNFGRVAIFHQALAATLGIPSVTGQTDIHVEYQGCSEKGLCYPPTTRAFRVGTTVGPADAVVRADATVESPASEQAGITGLLAGGSFVAVLTSFFGFGVLLAFTPCVFPMLPILSGIIVGDGANVTRKRAFVLSVAYALGMASMYTLAGIAAGLSGSMLSAALQNVWVLGAFAIVFVVLSLSMFGLYELQLPSALQSRVTAAAGHLRGGRIASVFAMGAVSALIVGPCVAAPLAGALLYISSSRDVVTGGAALFAMAIGMGVPLVAIGTSAGALMPRAGVWMESIKRLFGVMLLGVAIWLVSPVLPMAAVNLLAAALLIGVGVFLRALDPLPVDGSGWMRFGKAVGVFLLISGAALVVSTAGTLSQSSSTAERTVEAAPFKRVADLAELERELSRNAGKPAIVDFYADWCTSCKEMERFTLADPRVRTRLREATLLRVDVTDNRADAKRLLKRFDLFGPPGLVFFDAQGREMKHAQVVGYQPVERFLATLQVALGNP